MTDYTEQLSVAVDAVELASGLMREHLPRVLTAKGDRDMASDVDFAIEQQVRSLLLARTPDISFLGEEEGRAGATSDLMWSLDPIDGTANFVHGLPLCGVSLGLIHVDRPVLGVIALPFLGAVYTAVDSRGAQVNGHPIAVSDTDRLRDAIVAIGDYAVGQGSEHKNALRLAVTRELVPRVQRVRMHGSAAVDLAWLAEGRIDALIMLSNKPWDTAAGVVIAREAGARTVDRDGSPHTANSTATIAANPKLIDEVLELLQDATAALDA